MRNGLGRWLRNRSIRKPSWRRAAMASAMLAVAGPLAGNATFSAEAWIYWSGGTSYKQQVFDFGSGPTNYIALTPASSLTGHPMMVEIRTSTSDVYATARTLAAKSWQYVVVTEDAS